ncbi:MAG: cytochrome c maturation protein CcmE [Firmicutes bacterium]|jgi:cytochrome c-type biogenesis protein CcmE|nr:cytochrome c maturation protein CcmE [Bacillota bacterium]
MSLKKKQQKRRYAAVGLIFALAISFLIYKAVTSAFVYFETAQQALSQRGELTGKTFQIEGTVLPCSVKHLGGANYNFIIYSGKTHVRIENHGVPPQLFKPNVAVVLLGHFIGSSDVFSSSQILIKHSNQYVAAHPNRVKPGDASLLCNTYSGSTKA